MSTLPSANVTDVNLVLKERTHMRLCLNMLIFTHNLGNWLIQERYNIPPQPSAIISVTHRLTPLTQLTVVYRPNDHMGW